MQFDLYYSSSISPTAIKLVKGDTKRQTQHKHIVTTKIATYESYKSVKRIVVILMIIIIMKWGGCNSYVVICSEIKIIVAIDNNIF